MDENNLLLELETHAKLTREQALKVTVVLLQELHDRLSAEEADDLASELPAEFKARWDAFGPPGPVRCAPKSAADFVRHLAESAGIDECWASEALMTTFKALTDFSQEPHRPEGRGMERL
jgi:uncharacterized protein (DUF2267 family)